MPSLLKRAEAFKALGHPSRLAVLRRLVRGGEEGTLLGELQQALEIPASTLNHHLESLASVGLIKATRDGTRIRYEVRYPALHALTNYLWEDCCKGSIQAKE